MDYHANSDDDVPWADPAIQAGYQAALGRFLVAFNEIENRIGTYLENCLSRLGRKDLYRGNQRIGEKLYALDLVQLALRDMPLPDLAEIRSLNGERNKLAHGHFDQNPFSGEFEIVPSNGASRFEKGVEDIQDLAVRAEKAATDVRSCFAYIWFEDIDEAPSPPQTVHERRKSAPA